MHRDKLGCDYHDQACRSGARPGLVASSKVLTDVGLDPWIQGLRLWYLMLQDVTSESFMSQCLRARFVAYCDLPMLEVLDSLDKLCDAHLVVIANKAQPSFIRDVLRLVPDQCRGFIHTLERAIGDISSRDVPTVRSWRQILTFMLRPTFGRQLDATEFVLDWESRNATAYPEEAYEFGYYLFSVTDIAFEERVFSHGFGCHGPGSVTYMVGERQKTSRLTTNAKDKLLYRIEDFDIGLPMEIPCHDIECSVNTLLAVPKTWKKPRLIAVEPCNLQFHQQFLKNGLYGAIREDTFWSRHIDFEHAEKAYPLVFQGSRRGTYATVDLSAASDSVSVGHMLGLFVDYPDLTHALLRVRSQQTLLPDGKRVDARLAATMGNAFCFPVETLVFGVICVMAIDKCGGDVDHSRFRVYGDDIIIEGKYCDTLLDLLTEYGFCPNIQKTFSDPDSHFRESCGLECYMGQDVTPVRLPRSFSALNIHADPLDAISAWVALANECYGKLPSVRKEIVRSLVTVGHLAIPFSEDGSLGIRSITTPTNSHLIGGGCVDLQRDIRLYPALSQRTELREAGSLALYEWLGRAQESEDRQIGGLETSRVAARGVDRTINWF